MTIHGAREAIEVRFCAAGRGLRRGGQRPARLSDVPEALEERVHHGPLAAELVTLTVKRQRLAAFDRHRAAIGGQLSGYEPEQRALAGAVRCDERRAFTGVEPERASIEQGVTAVTEPEIANFQKR